MGLHYIYSNATGTTQDLTLRCRLYRLEVKVNAEEGSVAISSLIVDDPDGDLDLLAFRRLYIYDDLAPLGSQVVFNGYLSERDVTRGPNIVGTGRHWVVSLNDSNWVLSLRVMNGADANRPSETDVARITWLLTTTELNTVDDSRYVATTPTVTMDAADYRGQRVLDVIDDCAQQSGKNYFVWYAEDVGQLSLWYDDSDTSTQYTSTLRLSNELSEVDSVVTFAPSKEAVLQRSPQRLNSGIYLPYDGGIVYTQSPDTGDTYIYRDAVMPAENVKTLAVANTRALRYRDEMSTEEDVITTAYECDAQYVNLLMAGMRMQGKFVHLPGYGSFTWFRVLNRAVREIAEYRFEITVELSPQVPTVSTFAMLREPSTGQGTDRDVYWVRTGDVPAPGAPFQPSFGLVEYIGGGPPSGLGYHGLAQYFGFKMLGTGIVSVSFRATITSLPFPAETTIKWCLKRNLTIIGSSEFTATNYTTAITLVVDNIAVVPNDQLNMAVYSTTGVGGGFLVPPGTGSLGNHFSVSGTLA